MRPLSVGPNERYGRATLTRRLTVDGFTWAIVGGHTRCCYRRLNVRHLHPTCVQAPRPNPNPKQGQTSVMVYMFFICFRGEKQVFGGGMNHEGGKMSVR